MPKEGREVKYAALHTTVFIPGTIGQLGPTLTADTVGKTKDLKMTKVDDGLLVEIKGQKAWIPSSQIQLAVFKE